MADSFTDTTTQGFFSRLASSLMGLLVGPLIVIGAIFLLSWNEDRAVEAIKGLADAASKVVEVQSGAVLAANEGKLVHVTGAATAKGPIPDTDVGIKFPDQVAVQRTAEMYEWTEDQQEDSHTNLGGSKTTTTTYTYTKKWSDRAIDSSAFKHLDGHANPPMPFTSNQFVASDAQLGAYKLEPAMLESVDLPQKLAPSAPAGWTTNAGKLYKGDATAPKVGDMRVSYAGLPSGATLSVVAAQSHDGFAPFVTANGYQVQLTEVGNRPAAVMLADKRSAESTLTWILRAVGATAIFIGFSMFFNPLATLASVVPFLGWLARGAVGALAIAITIPLTLVVIAIAWIAFRPLLGIGLLAAAAVALYGLWRWHRSRTPRAPPDLGKAPA